MPSTNSRPSARELVGGRWAISLRGWLIFSALLFILGPLGIKSQLDVSVQTVAVIVGTGWLAMSVLYLAAHLTVFRNRHTAPRHVAWIIGLGVVVGAARDCQRTRGRRSAP